MIRVLMAMSLTAVTVSCQSEINEDEAFTPRLVMEGYINDDGHPVVVLTRTVSPVAADQTRLSDAVVRWAVVTVSDGERTVSLDGHYNPDRFPPFYYTTGDLVGEAGRTYTATATYGDMNVTSECSMPNDVIAGCSVNVGTVAQSDAYRSLSVDVALTSGRTDETFIQIFVRKHPVTTGYLPCFMGAYRIPPGEEDDVIRLDVCAAKSEFETEKYSPYFPAGTKVDIMVATVSREVWDFWYAYSDVTAFGGNIFLSAAEGLPGNVSGGLGVWSAQSSRILTVEVK